MKKQAKEVLMNDEDCIPIEQALKEAKERWQDQKKTQKPWTSFINVTSPQ